MDEGTPGSKDNVRESLADSRDGETRPPQPESRQDRILWQRVKGPGRHIASGLGRPRVPGSESEPPGQRPY